jgi:capsular exopolysaccharide synthesis family protein
MRNTNERESTNDQKMVSFGQLWSKYAAYWPLFLILILIAVSGAWLYLRYKVPVYQANARILIKDEKKGTEDSKAIEGLNLLTTKKIIENEQEVIQSRTLLSSVVKKLGLYAPIYGEGRIKTEPAYLTSPVIIEAKLPDQIKGLKKTYFEYNSSQKTIKIGNAVYSLNEWIAIQKDTVRFLPNRRYNGEEKSKYFFTLSNPRDVAVGLQSGLTVSTVSKLSSILDLKFKDEVPERAEDILNELLKVYKKTIIDDKNTLASNTLAFVEDRLSSVEKDLNAIEKRVQQYKASNGAVDIGMQGRLFLENVSTNDQRLSEINMQLAVLNQIESYVRSKNNSGGIVPSTMGINDPVLPELLNKLYSAELEYERLKGTKAENSPDLIAVTDQIAKMKPSILENVRNLKEGLGASKSNLASTNRSYTSILQSIPQKERELIDINREQSIKNDIYSFLLKKREETALTHAATVADSRVIDQAQASFVPISPKKNVIYPLAVIVALFLGIGIITARDVLNTKILFRHEVEKLTVQPIIGEVSFDKSEEVVVIAEGKKSFIAEQFRQLRIGLNYVGQNGQAKKILVTSAISGEGKSFVAINLAQSLALTGKKVVLVELDLHNPAISKALNIVNNQGASDYLSKQKELEEVIKRTEFNPNLFFIPSGQLPVNPTELLMNGRAKELIDYLESIFDYVVIDTAPVNPVTDAYILSEFCDTTLYIIRQKYTPKVVVQRIDENNRINRLHNIAIIFNGVHSRGFGSNNYGYGYGYGYRYIYTDGKYMSTPKNTSVVQGLKEKLMKKFMGLSKIK